MDYECEKCQALLGPGMLFCPGCGDKFPEPVPGTLPSNPGSFSPAPIPLIKSPARPKPDLAHGLSKAGGGLMGCGCLLAVLVFIIILLSGLGH